VGQDRLGGTKPEGQSDVVDRPAFDAVHVAHSTDFGKPQLSVEAQGRFVVTEDFGVEPGQRVLRLRPADRGVQQFGGDASTTVGLEDPDVHEGAVSRLGLYGSTEADVAAHLRGTFSDPDPTPARGADGS